MDRQARWIAFGMALALVTWACAETRLARVVTPVQRASTLDQRAAYLKVHMKDGRLYILSDWKVDEAAQRVAGVGRQFDLARTPVGEPGSADIPLPEVALFETNVLQSSPALRSLAVVSGVSVAVTAACVANSKACFGSCPTFYLDEDQTRPVAEGFSSSVAPALEARDVDALFDVHPRDRRVVVTMKNEALETHVVRYVQLLAARRPPAGRVIRTLDGQFRQFTDLQPPIACGADDGECLARVEDRDGRERWTSADGTDLAAKEVVELKLNLDGRPSALVLGTRQSLVSTYVIYQALAWFGRSASDVLASLGRPGSGTGAALARLPALMGGIDVLAEQQDGTWITAGTVREMGPLASDVVAVMLPPAATGRVRLRMGRGHWRVDYAASAVAGERVVPVAIVPESLDGVAPRPLTTLPGEVHRYAFELPAEWPDLELFLDTRGYYLEWMRQEWLAEEDAARATQLVLDPERVLRDLAPAFKAVEARMETQFWGSRYARE